MAHAETIIRFDHDDVEKRLQQLDLTLPLLSEVVAIAHNAAAEATPFHAVNAAGTFSYQQGTWALRDRICDEYWRPARPEGIEVIVNEQTGVKIAFCNVDVTCKTSPKPQPRSKKGAGTERAFSSNLLFDDLQEFYIKDGAMGDTFYLMLDPEGRAELSKPVIKEGSFKGFVERIWLPLAELDIETINVVGELDDDDSMSEFEPSILRK